MERRLCEEACGATTPEEDIVPPRLTMITLSFLGLSTSLSRPRFPHRKIEALHRVGEGIDSAHTQYWTHSPQFNLK